MPKLILIDLERVKDLHSKNQTVNEIRKVFCCSGDKIRKILKTLGLSINKSFKKHSDETKRIISEKRKKFLKENPDKHPWRNNKKFKSEPCESLKLWLTSKNIKFIPEYSGHGVVDRYFSIDIAMPDKRIALEVNGNQHYNSDRSLKPYYRERKELLESVGWKVYDIHYSICYSLDEYKELFLSITNSDTKICFDYNNPPAKTRKKKLCNMCDDVEIDNKHRRCETCRFIRLRKVSRPSKMVLHDLIWNYSLVEVGKKYSVSLNAVKKWCKGYNLDTPSQSFRTSYYLGKIIDYQI